MTGELLFWLQIVALVVVIGIVQAVLARIIPGRSDLQREIKALQRQLRRVQAENRTLRKKIIRLQEKLLEVMRCEVG